MPHKTYTHKDLAKQLNVSETTVKSYRRKFPGCIPVFSQGKPIRFSSDAMVVCKKIRDLFEQGMSIPEVHNRLMLEFSWIEPAAITSLGSEKKLLNSASSVGTGSSPGSFIISGTGIAANSGLAPGQSGEFAPGQKVFYDSAEAEGFVSLPQSFTTAISGLAKSVVALTRQQSVILERLTSLEQKITPAFSTDSQAGKATLVASASNTPGRPHLNNESQAIEALTHPKWADDLASRLEGMEQAIVRTLASFEGQFKVSSDLILEDKNTASSSFSS